MSPALQTLKAALERLDTVGCWGREANEARDALLACARAAGFSVTKCVEDWARYQVAVGEARDQAAETVEPEREPESGELFG